MVNLLGCAKVKAEDTYNPYENKGQPSKFLNNINDVKGDDNPPVDTPGYNPHENQGQPSRFLDNINEITGDNAPNYTPGKPKNNYAGMSWDQIKEQLDTPEKVLDYIITIRYQSEPRGIANHTQTPEETLRLGTGDCEDFGFLAKDALEHHGYKAKVLAVEATLPSGNHKGHALCIYKDIETNKWHYIQGYNVAGLTTGISEEFRSLDSMARDIARKMNGTLYWKDTYDSISAYKRDYDNNPNIRN